LGINGEAEGNAEGRGVDSVIVGNNLRSKDKGASRLDDVAFATVQSARYPRFRRKRERLYCTLLRKAGFVDSLY
jgi:hypothetical protein